MDLSSTATPTGSATPTDWPSPPGSSTSTCATTRRFSGTRSSRRRPPRPAATHDDGAGDPLLSRFANEAGRTFCGAGVLEVPERDGRVVVGPHRSGFERRPSDPLNTYATSAGGPTMNFELLVSGDAVVPDHDTAVAQCRDEWGLPPVDPRWTAAPPGRRGKMELCPPPTGSAPSADRLRDPRDTLQGP
jgi:hypothetical protein